MNLYPSLGWVHAVGLKKCAMNCVHHNRLYLLKPNSHYCMNFRLNVSNSYELILFNSRQKSSQAFLKISSVETQRKMGPGTRDKTLLDKTANYQKRRVNNI